MFVLVSAISYSAPPDLTKRRIEENNAILRSLPRGCANCFRTREAAESYGRLLPFETRVLEATGL